MTKNKKTTKNPVREKRDIVYRKGKTSNRIWRVNPHIKPSRNIAHEPTFDYSSLDDEHKKELERNRKMRTNYNYAIIQGNFNTGLERFRFLEKQNEPVEVVIPSSSWDDMVFSGNIERERQQILAKTQAIINAAKNKNADKTFVSNADKEKAKKIRAKIKNFGE